MELNDGTKRQFVKDFKLPIQIVEKGYFEYFIELFQDQYQSKDKLELLKETITQFEDIDDFNEYCRSVRHKAIDSVTNNEAFKEFSEEKLTSFNTRFGYKTNLYNHLNVGKTFVSIDLVKGNFQALKHFNPDILNGTNNYDEFLSQFTDLEYLKKSKQIRQVIFGKLQPKKQKKIQEYLMSLIKSELIKFGITEGMIKATSPDEIIFEIEDCEDYSKYEELLKNDSIAKLETHFEVFKLESVNSELDCFIKKYKNKKGIDIKKGNMKYMPELIKYIKKEPLIDKDLAFLDEGRIAFYKEPLFYKNKD